MAALALAFALPIPDARANPDGGTVVSGSATITQTDPKTLTINQQTDKAIINWRNFSIGAGETTRFVQPSAASAVLNRVTSDQVSKILGNLTANGKVFLINPNGVVFGNGAQVDVGSLITSTHDIKNQDFLADTLRFTLAGKADARIVNQGTISVKEGGLVALVAPSIENSGVIYARLGRVALAAGNAVTIDPYGDDLITFEVPESVAQGLVDPERNPLAALIDLSGDIIADGGGVLITADRARDAVDKAINMTGYVQARSLDVAGSKVVLDGGTGNVTLTGTINASGLGNATGGEVRVVTDGKLTTTAGSQILAEGGATGGDGGFAAVSAWAERELAGRISVKANAPAGENGWLYVGANTDAARNFANPNLDGAGRVGTGSNGVYFEANKGQTDDAVDFLARGSDATLFLSAADAVLAMQGESLTTSLDGSNQGLTATGEMKQDGIVNYLVGNDQSQWVTEVETYKQVRYAGVYEGIDLVYYGNRAGNLEYDLQVAAGADASQIKLDYSGAQSITKQANGDLVIATGANQVVQKAPLVYQETAEARVLVPGSYDIGADGKVAIKLDDYDRSKRLIVDPVVGTSTFLGGTGAEANSARTAAVAIDSSGNSYVTGNSASANFPTTGGDTTLGGASDAFVSKFDSSGNLVYSTYLGGGGNDTPFDIAVDGSGRAFVAGTTSSNDFAVTDATTLKGAQDGFITRLSAAGTGIEFATYINGTAVSAGVTVANTVHVDASGNFYAAGSTTATDFITTGGAYDQIFGGTQDGWITKYDNTDTKQWQTLLGGATAGSGQAEEIFGLDVDVAGRVYVTGRTQTTDFPTAGTPNQGATGGNDDAFVSQLSGNGATLLYSSYLGGSGNDTGYDIDVDGQGNIVVVGSTASNDFPTTNATQSTLNGASDAFVTKLNSSGTPLYSTYLGGSGADVAYRVAAGTSQGIVGVVGSTTSADLTVTSNANQSSSGGGTDGFVSVLGASGNTLYQTYLGGSGTDAAYGVDILGIGTLVAAGNTQSANFPVTSGAYQTALSGSDDAFLWRISLADLFATSSDLSSAQLAARSQFIGRTGDAPQPGGGPVVAATPPTAAPALDGANADALIGLQPPARIERVVQIWNQTGAEGAAVLMQGGGDYSFAERRAVVAEVAPEAVLGALQGSVDTLAQQAAVQLTAVAEGTGPTLAEFSGWLDANNATAAQSETYVAMYLRLAEAFEERNLAEGLASIAVTPPEIELADAAVDGGIGALTGSVLDESLNVEPVTAVDAVAGTQLVVSAGLDDGARAEAAFIGAEPVAIDAEGRFSVRLPAEAALAEAATITIVHADGSVSERPLFRSADPARPAVAGSERIDRLPDGRALGRLRLGDPAEVRQVLVEGRPVPVGPDGRIENVEFPPAAVARGYATLVVTRADGTSTLTRLAITEEPPLKDAVVTPDSEGGLRGRAKAGDAGKVRRVLVDGEPVEVADDGTFEFRLAAVPAARRRSVDVVIVYDNGAESHQALALEREPPLAGLDSYRTGGGLKMVEGRLENAENVAELKLANQIVPLEADGSFVVPVPAAAEQADGFVPLNVVYADGSVAAAEVAPTPEPVVDEVLSRLAADGSEVIEGRLAAPEGVAELRLGDQPILFTTDGRFSLSRAAAAAANGLTLTIVYADGTTRAQRLRGDRLAARITDVEPLRTPAGRRVTGRIADAGEVAQVWANGERLNVGADGRFAVTLAETSFNAAETLDVTLVFTDGSRLDRAVALRETPPVAELALTPEADGRPALRGRLARPGDVAEVLVDGRPVPVQPDGVFAASADAADPARAVSLIIRHRDGAVSERRLARPGRPLLADFRPLVGDADAGRVRAAGRVAQPETVAALEVAGRPVELAADGNFALALPADAIAANRGLVLTVVFKDGSRAEQRLALAAPPIAGELATLTAPDGNALVEGRLTETEDIAGVLVAGRLVPVDGEGRFRFPRPAADQAQLADINSEVDVTVLYADGRRAERRLGLDARPLLAEIDTVAADGALQLAARVERPGDVAQVLVDGQAVAFDGAGRFRLRLPPGAAEARRSVNVTVVHEDGTRRSRNVAVGTESLFAEMRADRARDGRAVLGGVLENAEAVAQLRIDGRAVPVGPDGGFEVSLARLATAAAQAVPVSILYRDGARAERRVALKEIPLVAEADLVTTAQGGAVASWRLAEPETIAEVRVDGRPLPLGPDGRVQMRLSEAQLGATDRVSLAVTLRDGSRREVRAGLRPSEAVAEFAGVAASELGGVVEGRIAEPGRIRRVLVDGAPLALGPDGAFRIDMAERAPARRSVLPLVVEYADGTRKVERLGVTPADMFERLEAVRAADGRAIAEGRVADPADVARVLVDGRVVELAQDGSFALDLPESRVNIARDVDVTVVYRDGARVSRPVALRPDAVLNELDVATAGAGLVVSGRLAGAERIQSVTLAGQPLALAADGSFRIEAPAGTEAATRELRIVYRDGTRQAKTLALATGRALVGIDTYAAADGAGVVEGRLADPGRVAAFFVDGTRVPVGADGGFVYRKRTLAPARSGRVPVRIVYRDGAVAGRSVAVDVTRSRPVMLVRQVSPTADGFRLMETVIGNNTGVAALEIDGRRYDVGADGRLAFALPAASPRTNVRVIYDNGLDAETWLAPARIAGGLIPLPRQPRRVALVIGNGRYGPGIGPVRGAGATRADTAGADAGLIGDMFRERFGFEPRVLGNASRVQMVAALRRLGRELGRNDQLVVHYAGRSVTDRRNGRSYWLASDARAASAANWVATDAVYAMLQDMGLRGAMVFSDAAFGVGRASRTLRLPGQGRGARTPVEVIASGMGRPVRAAPGDAHSAFTWRLASTLSGIASDVPAANLFDVIRERLTRPRPPVPGPTAALGNP